MMAFKKYLFTLVCSLLAFSAFATHNRAGEIIYEHVSGYTYKVTINTITKTSSFAADRPYLHIRWGDEPADTPINSLDSLPRSLEQNFPDVDAKQNQYIGYHTYAGPGIYHLVMEDPNRNYGVINILNSVDQVFCIETVLIISPVTGHNNSVQLLKPAIEDACLNQPWIHNPVAYDPDGDSLVYSLVPCKGSNAEDLLGWLSPEASTADPSDLFFVDSQTGDVRWISPPLAGEFNFAILVEEYRDGFLVGSVERDMQITVVTCNNNPPNIFPLADYCVEAGDILQFSVAFSDPNGDNVVLDAFGGPFTNVVHEAEFNPFTHQFYWQPLCAEVRAAPYTVSFEATDDGYIPLSDIKSSNILVVAPKVQNVQAVASGTQVTVTWNPTPCVNIFSAFEASQVKYLVYRKENGLSWSPSDCELGMPAYTQFLFIGETQGVNNCVFVDNAPGFGAPYCYRIVTVWPDGALSYASEEACVTIKKDAPVITKASIEITDLTLGSDTIWWSPPSEIDTLSFLPPYHYELQEEVAGTWQTLYVTPDFNFLYDGDTTFIHTGINTVSNAKKYRVEFYNQGNLTASSSVASTPFLELTPADNQISLAVTGIFPWINYTFYIYRKAPGEVDFTLLTQTNFPNYIDTGLTNNQSYCYQVLTQGTYDANSVPDTLLNWSQQVCASPYDATPPCAPLITGLNDCTIPTLSLNWGFLDPSCANDVTAYVIYYALSDTSNFYPIDTIQGINNVEYEFVHPLGWQSIAGCYYVTALDSLNLWPDGLLHQNESDPSNTLCVDNCPEYSLPNVITPDLDGINDVFFPFPYRSIKDIDLKIYNRYGTLVFETTDRDINWNGSDQKSGELCSDGVYYYTVTINTIRLHGIIAVNEEGYIQLLNATNPTPQH